MGMYVGRRDRRPGPAWPSRRSASSRPSRPCTCRGSARWRRSRQAKGELRRGAAGRRRRRSSTPTTDRAPDGASGPRRASVGYGFARRRRRARRRASTSRGRRRHALRPPAPAGERRPVRSRRSGGLSVHNALAAAAVGHGRRADPRRDRAGARPLAGPRRIGPSSSASARVRSSTTATTHRRAR